MKYQKFYYIFAAVITLFVMSACGAKQTVSVVDATAKKKGNINVFPVHFPAGSGDTDNIPGGASYPEEHYGLGVVVDTATPTLNEDFSKITAVGVRSKTDNKILTDETYFCDKSPDIQNSFGCRLSAQAVQNNKAVYLDFLMTDGAIWTTEEVIDLNSPDEFGNAGGAAFIQASASGHGKEFTLKSCPPDATGKQIEIPMSQPCPCGASETYVWLTGTCEDLSKSKKENCPTPNYIDTAGNCVQVSQSQKDICASGNYILLGGKGCGATCGANQIAKMGMCVCLTNYVPDPANPQNCIANPALNQNLPTSSPSSGGGSCSLIR